MKKIIKPRLTILAVLIFAFAACEKPDQPIQDPPGNAPPYVDPVNTADNSNTAPTVNIGSDIKLEIPNTYTKLPFTAYDKENNIKTYSWIKISGPESYFIESPDDELPVLFWLEEGDYEFELTVTDAIGLSGKDTIKVTVSTNLRKHVLHGLQPDASYIIIAEIPEEVKKNIKWVYAKSAGYNEQVSAGALPGMDYSWGGYYYELLSGNRILVYGGNVGQPEDIVIYY